MCADYSVFINNSTYMEDMIMAEKKTVNKDGSRNVKPIRLHDSVTGDIYVLEFNRETVKYAEDRGFRVNALDEGAIVSATEELFWYAFKMHHPNISRAETDKILYDKLKGLPKGMMERLVDLYLEPVYTLGQSEEDAKNATMTAEF